MKTGTRKQNILYCSGFKSFRIHRHLVRMAAELNCHIIAIPWAESKDGSYTGPFPIDGVISHLEFGRTGAITKSTGNVPHVTLHPRAARKLRMPSVVGDHVRAGRMAAEHFLKLGFTNFAAFIDSAPYETFNLRVQGYTDTIVKAGFPPPEVMIDKNDQQKIFQHFSNALKKLQIPFAIMSANDRVAAKIMDACRLADLTIPFQVAVCGFDNDPITCDVAPVPLSSVDTNPEQQAYEAFNMLLQMLNGKKPTPRHVVIPPKELVVRRSSGLQAHADGTVAKALAYIHEQAWSKDLQIPMIAANSGVSKSTLFHLFNKSMSMTPLQYITQLRVDKARELMRETGQNINQVRPRCGFATDYQMYRAFKRITGKSPGNFK